MQVCVRCSGLRKSSSNFSVEVELVPHLLGEKRTTIARKMSRMVLTIQKRLGSTIRRKISRPATLSKVMNKQMRCGCIIVEGPNMGWISLFD